MKADAKDMVNKLMSDVHVDVNDLYYQFDKGQVNDAEIIRVLYNLCGYIQTKINSTPELHKLKREG